MSDIRTYHIRTDEPDVTEQVLVAAPDLLRAAKEAQLVLLGFDIASQAGRHWEAILKLQQAIDKASLGAAHENDQRRSLQSAN